MEAEVPTAPATLADRQARLIIDNAVDYGIVGLDPDRLGGAAMRVTAILLAGVSRSSTSHRNAVRHLCRRRDVHRGYPRGSPARRIPA